MSWEKPWAAGEVAVTPASLPGKPPSLVCCAHTPAWTIPHFFLFPPGVVAELPVPSHPSLCFLSTLPSLHGSAPTSTQPSQADWFFVLRPDTSEGAWEGPVTAGWAWRWGAALRGSCLSPTGCSSGDCQPLSSGLNKCLGAGPGQGSFYCEPAGVLATKGPLKSPG